MRWCESTANDNNIGTYNAAENFFIFANAYPQSSQPRFGETAQGTLKYIPRYCSISPVRDFLPQTHSHGLTSCEKPQIFQIHLWNRIYWCRKKSGIDRRLDAFLLKALVLWRVPRSHGLSDGQEHHSAGRAKTSPLTLRFSQRPSVEWPTSLPFSTITLPRKSVITG